MTAKFAKRVTLCRKYSEKLMIEGLEKVRMGQDGYLDTAKFKTYLKGLLTQREMDAAMDS